MTYSPVLAMVTAAFEIAAAVWVLRGPGRRAILSTTGAILLFLAGYQIVEVAICSAAPGYGFLPRLTSMAVSWLLPVRPLSSRGLTCQNAGRGEHAFALCAARPQ